VLNRGRIALVVAAVAALALAAWFVLVQVQARQGAHGEITSITFEQSQAVEGFDDDEYTQTDPGAIAEFQALLDEFGIVPGQTDLTAEGCPGSLSTELTIAYGEGATVPMSLDTCGAAAHADFMNEATDLVSSWREALG
jgi:hypothetical protein